jgi:hypothetical protein
VPVPVVRTQEKPWSVREILVFGRITNFWPKNKETKGREKAERGKRKAKRVTEKFPSLYIYI